MRAQRIDADDLYFLIYGSGYVDMPWTHVWGNNGWVNDHWELAVRPETSPRDVGLVDMAIEDAAAISEVLTRDYYYSGSSYTLNSGYWSDDFRTADRLTLDHHNTGETIPYKLALLDVEYVDAPVGQETHFEMITKDGFVTDGSLASITARVGHHDMTYTWAVRDSQLFLGDGYDTVTLADNLDAPGTQYWSLIRRADGELDAYSLFSGHRVQMADGHKGWTANPSYMMNYGEVEKVSLLVSHANGGHSTTNYLPGEDMPNGGDRGTASNIDLRSDGEAHSDSFNLAYFNFIRYTSDNVWAGEATVHDGGTTFSAVSDRTVTEGKYGYDAAVLDGTLSVIGQSRNGTHDLIVEEQSAALDGKLRLYTFDVASGLYNEFNKVFLGSAQGENPWVTGPTGNDVADRVALYGFGGNDTLTAGASHDYLFGGQSVYNQTVAALGNTLTGGNGADYFGVGHTNTAGVVTGANTTLGHAGTGLFHQGYATDVIADWQAGEDTLVVLSNGVAVIGGLRQSTADGGAQINMNLGNTIDLRDVAATATSDQNESGARGNDGLDAVPNLETAFIAQATRDSKSIENENDISVVNEGLIVARGLGGDDILFGSAGDDYLYGNTGDNIVILSEGGSDRVYYDTFNGADARHFVSDFNRSGDAETDTSGDDLFFVNKRVIDAFGGNTARALTADDVGGTYTQAVTYNPRINFLHDNFYSPPILTPNTTHDNEDGQAPSNMFGSDGTTFGIGVGMTAVGYVLMGVPFAQAIGAALIASGSALSVGSVFVHTDEHKNATYDGDVSNYLNVITADTQQTVGNTVVATQAGVEDSNVSFLDFFRGSNAGDGFIPVVEFTNSNVNGVYGYFALHSNTETFVYLVASADNLVENGEAIKVAEINGLLTADDFRVYDGEADIYNVGTEPDVVLSTPAVTQVADAASNSGMGDQLIDDVQGAVKVTIDVADGIVAGSTLRVYDGTTLIYDSSNQTLVDADVTAVLNGNTYTLSDNRPLGTVAQQTDTADIDTDNAFVLRDTNVIYSVELRDGVTGIPTRAASPSIKITGGTGVIDGGLGADMLTVSGTSDFMNTATDAQIIGMETISLSAVDTNLDTVVDANDNPVVLDLSNQTDGFNIYGSSLADTITGSDGDDTVVGLSGQDYIDLGGLGNDEVTFTYLNDNLGNDNAYDTVVGLDSTDKMFVAAGGWVDHDDDSATADQRRDGFEDRDGDTTRLMYEMSTSATSNTNVSSGTELLIVSQSSVSTTGDLTNNIAAALSSAFNLAGLDGNVPSPTSGGGTDSSVLFAVKSDDASYWVGRYEDREGDDYAVGSEIEVFARVSADNILNSFWLDTVLAPQALTLTMPTDTGRNDGAGTYYTNDNTFEVGGLQSGNSIYYSLNGGSDWATAPVDQTFVTLAQGTYSPGSIKIRQVDPDGNYSNYSYETTSSSKTVVVDTMANAVTLTDEINGQTSADTVVLNWGTAGGAAPNADIDVYYKLGTGSYTAVDLSAGATSLHLGTLSVGTYTWYVTSTDAAGNTGASAQDTFTIVSPAPAQVAVWDSIETGDPQSANTQIGASLANSYVSLGEFTPTVANNSGVTGSHYVNVNDNDIMFDFDQNAQINGITVNSVKFGKYDNTGMATPSYGVSQTDWVFYVNDLVSDVGSSDHRTGEDYRLDVDLTISMLDGGTTTFDRTFYIDFEAAP